MREWLALIEWMMSQAAQVDALMTELGLTEPHVLIFWIIRKLSLESGQVKDIMHLNFQMSPPLVAVYRFTSYLARSRASDLNF